MLTDLVRNVQIRKRDVSIFCYGVGFGIGESLGVELHPVVGKLVFLAPVVVGAVSPVMNWSAFLNNNVFARKICRMNGYSDEEKVLKQVYREVAAKDPLDESMKNVVVYGSEICIGYGLVNLFS